MAAKIIREAAVSEAHRILSDRIQFKLDPVRWQEFNELLDRSPHAPEGLRKLYSKASVFE